MVSPRAHLGLAGPDAEAVSTGGVTIVIVTAFLGLVATCRGGSERTRRGSCRPLSVSSRVARTRARWTSSPPMLRLADPPRNAAELLGIRPSTVKRPLADLRVRSGLTTEQLIYAGRAEGWLVVPSLEPG